MELKYTLEHKAGPKHGNADGLSRQNCGECKQCDLIEREMVGIAGLKWNSDHQMLMVAQPLSPE